MLATYWLRIQTCMIIHFFWSPNITLGRVDIYKYVFENKCFHGAVAYERFEDKKIF